MKLKKINACIHDRTAYQLIIDDNESFEVVRSDDPELIADKGHGRNNNFYRNPKPLMYFSTSGISLFESKDEPGRYNSPKIHHLGLHNKSFSISEIDELVKIAETSIELNKLLEKTKL